jgi:hypothetical protein
VGGSRVCLRGRGDNVAAGVDVEMGHWLGVQFSLLLLHGGVFQSVQRCTTRISS